MGKFKNILWDVDDTLLDFHKSERYALSKTLKKHGVAVREEYLSAYHTINQSYWKRLETGEITKEMVLRGRFFTFFEQYSIKGIDPDVFRADFQEELSSVFFYIEDSLALCTQLRESFCQYIVTNGVTATQKRRLSLSGFDKIMDGIFISEEIGVPKPDPAFFSACFEQIPSFKKEETIIIGDSLSSDIRGGNLSGITACWYNPAKKPKDLSVKVDMEISSLEELHHILVL